MASLDTLIDPRSGERKYLNAEERRAFLEGTLLKEANRKYYCQLLYFTGCRVAEGLQVTPRRLDYADRSVGFQTLKQGKDAAGEQRTRYRSNELPEAYLQELQGVYSILKRKKSAKQADVRIWGFTERTAYNYVTEVMAEVGITGPGASPKGLRHGMGVALAMNGVPATVVQKVLGHSRIENTLIYLELVGREKRELVSRVW